MDHHLTDNSTDHLFVSQTTQHFTENPKHLSHNHSIPLWNALLKYCAFFWLLWRWEAKTPSNRIWNLNFCIYSFKCLPTTLAMLLVLLKVTEKAGAFLQLAFRTLDFRWWQADDAPLVSSGSTMGGMRSGSSSSPACSPVARIRLRSKKSGTSMAKSVEKTSVSKPESNGRLHYLMIKTIKKQCWFSSSRCKNQKQILLQRTIEAGRAGCSKSSWAAEDLSDRKCRSLQSIRLL